MDADEDALAANVARDDRDVLLRPVFLVTEDDEAEDAVAGRDDGFRLDRERGDDGAEKIRHGVRKSRDAPKGSRFSSRKTPGSANDFVR